MMVFMLDFHKFILYRRMNGEYRGLGGLLKTERMIFSHTDAIAHLHLVIDRAKQKPCFLNADLFMKRTTKTTIKAGLEVPFLISFSRMVIITHLSG
jgi:hypothetical protein